MSKGGRPMQALTLTDDERQTLQAWARRPKTAQRLALRSRIVLACGDGPGQRLRRRQARRQPRHRRQVAAAVPRRAPGRPLRRAQARCPSHDHRREGRGGHHQDAGDQAQERHPLEHPLDGQGGRPVADRHLPRLACLRPQAAPGRDLQALDRPALHRQGPRRGRPLPRPARPGVGPLRRREEPGPGVGPHPAAPADGPRLARAAHRTTTPATARPRCSPRWTWRRARSSASATSGTGPGSSSSSSTRSTRRCPARRGWRST